MMDLIRTPGGLAPAGANSPILLFNVLCVTARTPGPQVQGWDRAQGLGCCQVTGKRYQVTGSMNRSHRAASSPLSRCCTGAGKTHGPAPRVRGQLGDRQPHHRLPWPGPTEPSLHLGGCGPRATDSCPRFPEHSFTWTHSGLPAGHSRWVPISRTET